MDFCRSIAYWSKRLAARTDAKKVFAAVEKATTLELICEELEKTNDVHVMMVAVARLIKRDADALPCTPPPPPKRQRVLVPDSSEEVEATDEEEEEDDLPTQVLETSEEEEEEEEPARCVTVDESDRLDHLLQHISNPSPDWIPYKTMRISEFTQVNVGEFIQLNYTIKPGESAAKSGVARVVFIYRVAGKEEVFMEVQWCWNKVDLLHEGASNVEELNMTDEEMCLGDLFQAGMPAHSIKRLVGSQEEFEREFEGRFFYSTKKEELQRLRFCMTEQDDLQVFVDFLGQPHESINQTAFWREQLATIYGVASEIGTIQNPMRKEMKWANYDFCKFTKLAAPRRDKCALCGSTKMCTYMLDLLETPVGFHCMKRADILRRMYELIEHCRKTVREGGTGVAVVRPLHARFLAFVDGAIDDISQLNN